MKLVELRQQKGELVTQMRAILDRADAEKRAVSGEEDQAYKKIEEDLDKTSARIVTEEQLLARERESVAEAVTGQSTHRAVADAPPVSVFARPEYRAAFAAWLGGGNQGLSAEQRALYGEAEQRAMTMGNQLTGGAWVAPQEFVNELLKGLDDAVTIRSVSRKFTLTGAQSLGVPTLDSDLTDADWTPEIAKVIEDPGLGTGKREFRPHGLSKLVKLSNKLARNSAIPVESYLQDRLKLRFGYTEEKGFMVGDGAQKPLGVFIPSTNGISTARDISLGNTTTAIQGDGLIEAKYSLKQAYWSRASTRWLFHRDGVKNIRKIKNSQGDYVWRAGLSADRGDTILDIPVLISEFAPNVFTTGKYVGLLGDFQYYWIVDALDIVIQRLLELYAETNQIGFIGRKETDGMPVLEEAFARITLA